MRERGTSTRVARVGLVLLAGLVGAVVPSGTAAGQASADRAPVLVVGHRGSSKAAPEHTGAAYDLAVRQGVDVLECDLQLTKDEQLVCVHDTTVDRTTGGTHTGRVDSYTLAELREMDFGSWFAPEFAGARIVTLEEQLTCYRGIDPSLQFYLETKAPAEYGGRMEPLLVDALENLDVVPEGVPDVRSSPVIVQSFDLESLTAVRGLAPSLPIAYLTSAAPDAGVMDDLDVLAANAAVFTAEPASIEGSHAAGREAHTWTVDDPAQMQALIDAGIDGFFTNVPDVARQVVDAAGRGTGRRPQSRPAGGPAAAGRAPGCPEGMGIDLDRAEAPTFTAAPDSAPTTPGSGSAAATVPPTVLPTDQLDPPSTGSIPILPVAIVIVLLVLAGFLVAGRRASSRSGPG